MEDKTPKKDDDMSKEKKEDKFDENGNLYIKLTIDDSALVVRADGAIEMISHELEKADGGYVGDVEDLNKTFSLVLALASALENEDLYNRIYHNLNMVLMQKWDSIPDDIKADIIHNRRNEALNRTDEERHEKNKRVEDFRARMNRYKDAFLDEEKRKLREDMQREAEFMQDMGEDFADPSEVRNHMEDMLKQQGKPKRKKLKRNPLANLRNVNWNPYDETLVAKKGQWRLDYPPKDED